MSYDSKILFEKLYMIPNLKKNFAGCFLVRKNELLETIDNIYATVMNDIMAARKNDEEKEFLSGGNILDALKLLEDSIESFPQFLNLVICPSRQYLDLVKNAYEKLPEALKQ